MQLQQNEEAGNWAYVAVLQGRGWTTFRMDGDFHASVWANKWHLP